MRPFEILLILTDLVALVGLALPLRVGTRPLWWLAPVFALLALIAHLLGEGARSQMVPAYALTGLLLTAWLARIPRSSRRPARTRWGRLGLGIWLPLAALGLAISAAVPTIFPVFRFPRPSGPYDIGTVTYHWIDDQRAEIFTSDPGDPRELMVQVWYPAKAEPSSPRAPYLQDPGVLAPLARLLHLPPVALSHLKYVRTNAAPGAPVADGEAAYPVLIFSHGRGGYRQHNTWQIEELVSHGYIVAAIDHPYAAAGVAFPDGRIVSLHPSLAGAAAVPEERAKVDRATPYFGGDVSFTLDQLAEVNLSDPKGLLTGRLDLGRTGVFGVSLGGAIAAEACRMDARTRACLFMDEHMPDDIVRSGLHKPTMWLTRDVESMRDEGWAQAYIDVIETTTQAVFGQLAADGYIVRIRGAYHTDFSDAELLSPAASLVGLTGPIGGERARAIIADYSRAFLDTYVKGEPAALLADTPPPYPEVIIESRKSGSVAAASTT